MGHLGRKKVLCYEHYFSVDHILTGTAIFGRKVMLFDMEVVGCFESPFSRHQITIIVLCYLPGRHRWAKACLSSGILETLLMRLINAGSWIRVDDTMPGTDRLEWYFSKLVSGSQSMFGDSQYVLSGSPFRQKANLTCLCLSSSQRHRCSSSGPPGVERILARSKVRGFWCRFIAVWIPKSA